MSYTSFDPRVTIRENIGTSKYMYDNDYYCITVSDDYGEDVNIPLLLPSECRTEDMFPMPFIEMTLVSSNAVARNVGGNVRDTYAYIDFNIYYVNNDEITSTNFGKNVADELVDSITSVRSSIPDTYFVEVVNDGREILESYNNGKLVVFHRVLEIKAYNIDNG